MLIGIATRERKSLQTLSDITMCKAEVRLS